MTKDEALKLALSTLNEVRSETFRLMRNGQTLYAEKKVWDTITAIKEALAQPEQEPVCDKDPQGCWSVRCQLGKKCKNTPAQRIWVGLTDEEVDECYYWKDRLWTTDELVRHVEAKLKEKNT